MTRLDEIRARAESISDPVEGFVAAQQLAREDVPALLAVAEAARKLLKLSPEAFIGWAPAPTTDRKISKRFDELAAALARLEQP